MNDDKEKVITTFGFPTSEGIGAGSVTRVEGGYLGQTQGGVPFIIGDAQNLVATFKDMAEKLAFDVMAQLDTTTNLNKLINFTFMIDEKNSLVPADLPEQQKKVLLSIIHGFRAGKFEDSEEIEMLGEGPIVIDKTEDNINGNNKNLNDEDGVTKAGLKKINDAKDRGSTIIIEKGSKKE